MFYIVNRVWDVENKKKQKGDKQEISGSRLQREQPIEKEVLLVLSYTTCVREYIPAGTYIKDFLKLSTCIVNFSSI